MISRIKKWFRTTPKRQTMSEFLDSLPESMSWDADRKYRYNEMTQTAKIAIQHNKEQLPTLFVNFVVSEAREFQNLKTVASNSTTNATKTATGYSKTFQYALVSTIAIGAVAAAVHMSGTTPAVLDYYHTFFDTSENSAENNGKGRRMQFQNERIVNKDAITRKPCKLMRTLKQKTYVQKTPIHILSLLTCWNPNGI